MTSASTQTDDLVCSVEIVDPWSDPDEYGSDRLVSQIIDLARLYESNTGSDSSSILGSRTLTTVSAVNWLRLREHMYDVIKDGRGVLRIPFLCCSAPSVQDVSVSAKRSHSSEKSRGVTLKLLGTGFSADAKLTITKSIELTCETGERRAIYVELPVIWEERALGNHHKYRWLFVEPQRTIRELPVLVDEISAGDWGRWSLAGVPEEVSNKKGGSAPLKIDRSYTFASSSGFDIGFEAAGFEIDLTVESENSTSIDLATSLPGGSDYLIRWLGRPPGVDLTAI